MDLPYELQVSCLSPVLITQIRKEGNSFCVTNWEWNYWWLFWKVFELAVNLLSCSFF